MQFYDLGRQNIVPHNMQAFSPVGLYSNDFDVVYQSDETGLSVGE